VKSGRNGDRYKLEVHGKTLHSVRFSHELFPVTSTYHIIGGIADTEQLKVLFAR
jgi:hypothetical protein